MKLTPEIKKKIVHLVVEEKLEKKVIAERFGCSPSTICQLVKEHTRKEVSK